MNMRKKMEKMKTIIKQEETVEITTMKINFNQKDFVAVINPIVVTNKKKKSNYKN